jgi:phosphoribosylanthranilate isomerase
MLIVKVKICGITNYDDAIMAVGMGADMLGFNFYKGSPRYIEPAKAAEIINKLPAFVDLAGVFVNSSYEEIRQIMEECQLNWIQLHGDETREFCDQFLTLNVKIMKAIRVRGMEDLAKAEEFFTDAILLDAFQEGKYGGTGLTFDWNILGSIEKRVFLAGGINPENAPQAISPGVYGIDVCSGIESEPGKKDPAKMKQLFDNIRHLRG